MSEIVAPLEAAEVGAWTDLFRSAGPEVVEASGARLAELEDGIVMAATRLDVLAVNRAVGVGIRGRPGDEALTVALETFEAIGSPRFFFQVAPNTGCEDLGRRLEALGLRPYNNWVRLKRELTDLPEPPGSTVSVGTIGPAEAETFSGIVADAFGYPPTIAPLTGCVIGRDGWTHYLAYEDDGPIAAAAMYAVGEAAWFGFAATVAERRGRGAQTALVIRRMHDARAAGCRWVSVETAEPTPGHEAPSYRNLVRLGFAVGYLRPNYLWTREAPAVSG